MARTRRAAKKAQDTRMADPNDTFDPTALANALDEVATATPPSALGHTPVKKGGKRKADDNYSNNRHTIRAREYVQKQREDPERDAIFRAKNADNKARNRALKKCRDSVAFKEADATLQAKMLVDVVEDVMRERRNQKCDAESVQKSFQLQDQVANAEDDAGYTSAQFSDDESEEAILLMQEADRDNEVLQFAEPLIGNKEVFVVKASKIALRKNYSTNHILYKIWRDSWVEVFQSLRYKLKVVDCNLTDLIKRLPAWKDPKTGKRYPVVPPHRFFTNREKMCWRNLVMWHPDMFETSSKYTLGQDSVIEVGAWYPRRKGLVNKPQDIVMTFPGPGEWWEMIPGYDTTKAGFYFPKGHPQNYERVVQILGNRKNLPDNGSWGLIRDGDSELCIRW